MTHNILLLPLLFVFFLFVIFFDTLLGLVVEEILNISTALKFMKDDMMQLIKVFITIWKVIQQS